MKAEIVTTGTELLLGEIVDTNAAYIARQVRDVGLNLYYKTTVGDNRQRLADVLRQGLERSDIIIVTGGLGPTVDDITREAVADATGRPLEQRPEIVRHLEQQFARWGRKVGENNLRQTYLPQGALMLSNPIGTAPGFIVETEQGAIICMPGVPREMKRMMADHVLPYLQEKLGARRGVIVTRVLHTAGIGESSIDDKIGHLMTSGNPTVGLAAHMGRADIRIGARGATEAEARALIEPVEREIREKLGHWIYGVDEETLGSVVAGLLRRRNAKLGLAETNSQGRLRAAFGQGEEDVLAGSILAET
ncbi:MAG: CinA family nicotinamide mononucleotide deamidase-related protein, partial [Caldilineae bacterium]